MGQADRVVEPEIMGRGAGREGNHGHGDGMCTQWGLVSSNLIKTRFPVRHMKIWLFVPVLLR